MFGQTVTDTITDQQAFELVLRALKNKTYREMTVVDYQSKKLTLSQIKQLSNHVDSIVDVKERLVVVRIILDSFWINSFVTADALPQVCLTILLVILTRHYRFHLTEDRKTQVYSAAATRLADAAQSRDVLAMMADIDNRLWVIRWMVISWKAEPFRKFWTNIIKWNDESWQDQTIISDYADVLRSEDYLANLALVINTKSDAVDDLTLFQHLMTPSSEQDSKSFVLSLLCKGADLHYLRVRYKYVKPMSTKFESIIKTYRSLVLPILIPLVGRDVGGLVFEYAIGSIVQ